MGAGIWRSSAAVALICVAQMAWAQQRVGSIEFAQGMTTVQQKSLDPRFVTKGDALFEGDMISTTEKGYAVLSLTDGTKITLRPSTSFAVEQFAHDQGTESALLHLVKGGLRAITGLIGKRNPDAFRVTTPSATIGIRGTKFDARLCAADCREEQLDSRPPLGQRAPIPAADTVIARVVRLSGEASIARGGQASRSVLVGTPVLVGDLLSTGASSNLVLGFRDQTRISLEAQTVFRVEEFKYGHSEESDNIALRLLKGGLRAFTGLIAKTRPDAVSVRTASATIGIRGTGLDMSCEGSCAAVSAPASELCPAPPAPDKSPPPKKSGKNAPPPKPEKDPGPDCRQGLFVHTWDGQIFMSSGGQTVDVPLDQAGTTGADGQAHLLAAVPAFMNNFASPRPDTVDVDWVAQFTGNAYDGADGLYTLVRDGYVFLDAGGGHLDLGPGEGAVVAGDGIPQRLEPIPAFLLNDPFPAPEDFNLNDSQVLQLFGATLGSPGQEVCEIK